ncbi:cobaltochelatase subunit CobN [Methanimicrococcus blatticola]|uniref:CobN/magnesium chelatase n=1 Tax=Methanimicrococcus blatticola TaxID=91560 RepID=A0A484F6Y6_9EURY|nr:cobaltochelatase subunit CobN [Methanimicrococcus blatticola]MBZ3935084.1 cobaltochelatase subunit CobN [Methanimicrococcus blatticola]MCC2508819.1 cobaltochelatase subunit CobN [Methanimicrococcus blatticola]TDQ71152.1 CobN/magnesium chelatase [Methanimicrococcus blatticola]
MISTRKVKILFVLTLLLFSMIPTTIAGGGNNPDKIDVLYIGWADVSMLNMPIAEEMEMYYKDDFTITILDYFAMDSLTAEQLKLYDIVICDMIFFGTVDSETENMFKEAHDAGVMLIAFANDGSSGTVTPEFFDFRDTAELTVSKKYTENQIKIFFDMYKDMKDYMSIDSEKEKKLKQVYTENILMYLASLRSEHDDITNDWEKIDITYISFNAHSYWGSVNQYSSFMNFTFINFWNDAGKEKLIEMGNSGDLKKQDLIVVYMTPWSNFEAVYNEIDSDKQPDLEKIYTFGGSGFGNESWFDGYDESDAKGEINQQSLIYCAIEFTESALTTNWVLKEGTPKYGIYHPDLKYVYYENLDDYLKEYETAPGPWDTPRYQYSESNLTVGIWFHKSYFSDQRYKIIDDLIHDLEGKGINVIAGYDIFQETIDGDGDPINPMMKYYAKNDKVMIDSAISIKDFALSYNDYDAGIEWLEELNVTVLKAVIASTGDSIEGIPKDMLIYSTVSPNRDGMSDFIILGNLGKDGPETFDEQKDWLANRAIKWAYLKSIENENKKIVIMYYNYPPGKADIGANYLNVMKSFAGTDIDASETYTNVGGLLREMDKEKYTVSFNDLPIEKEELNDTTLLNLVYQQGINVGAYAPGVLDEMVAGRGDTADEDWWGATLVPVEEYKEWFDETIQNESIRKNVIDSWGEPWDYTTPLDADQSGMIWEDEYGKRFFVLPAVRFGNVWLMPQPDRALATDKAFSYHSGDIPPTHQYIAYYLWLNNEFKPDAIINFGTHGTHEWLPGAAYGLSAKDDLSPLLLQDIPNIYPYIVANVGEGLTAEYRGNALIIDHMTPPMIRSNLDSNADLKYLEEEIQAYFIGQDAGTNKQRQAAIVDRMFEAGIHDVIGTEKYKKAINSANPEKVTEADIKTYLKEMTYDDFSIFLKDDLYDYIETIKESTLPYGMHVYGKSPTEDQISAMLRAMWGLQFDDALYKAYYEEKKYVGIPYEDNGKIHSLVSDMSTKTTPSEMIDLLEAAYPDAEAAKHESVVQFIFGPVMYFEGKDNAADVINKWKETGAWDELIDEVIFAYYFYAPAAPEKTELEGKITEVVTYCIDHKAENGGKVDAELINEALSATFKTQSHQNKAVVSYLTGYARLDYAQNLRDCGDSEMKSILKAMSGGYITPNAGNDPIQNPSAIPTGKNFYGIDPTKFPTKSAWEVGKSLADQMIADYYLKYGEFPDTVAFSRFGVEFIRDEGALEACALYLLGVEPVWDANGNVDPKSVKVIPLEELEFTYTDKNGKLQTERRPRIDILYTTAGMRDAFGDKLKLINVGVKAVSDLDESDEWNYVRKNTQKLLKNPATKDLAYVRCFANELGNYEIGTGNQISASGSWDDPQSIVDTYLKNMGYAYGDDSSWGVSAQELLKALLKNVDASVHADSSNLYDTLDNDDFFQYFGALNMASKYLRDDNKMPEMYVADTKNVGRNARFSSGQIYGMKEYLNIDLESRYLNEEWIKGMMESGYSGSTMYAEFVDNLFGWAVTSDGDLVSFKNWEAIYDIYVNDRFDLGLDEYFKENPYAYQSITARMLESIRKDYLTADPTQNPAEYERQMEKLSEMEKTLVNEYMQSVIDQGVSCCHHTCGNVMFDEFMKGQLSVLGVDPDKEQLYWDKVTGATYREEPVLPPKSTGSGGSGFGSATLGDAGEPAESNQPESGEGYGTDGGQAGNTAPEVTGYQMTMLESVTNSVKDFIANPTFSSSSLIAIAFVILVVGAVFFGFRRRGI